MGCHRYFDGIGEVGEWLVMESQGLVEVENDQNQRSTFGRDYWG